jgi:uncharacterized protein with FMN-binding domain
MKRAIFAILVTVTGLVLLLSFKTHATASTTPSVISGTSTGDSSTSTTPSATPTPSASSTPRSGSSTGSSTTSRSTPSASASSASTSKTVTGAEAQTRYGPVQVQITVVNGTVTKAVATEYPTDQPRDQQINSYAIPQLQQETVGSSTANIDMVSGATYTSQGYITSLQSALDKLKG